MSDNIDIDGSSNGFEITADSPTAYVSKVGQHYSVIGGDDGKTVYASGIPQEDTAGLVAEKINEMREAEQYDLNAERVAEDDDVLFAITREDGDSVLDYAIWFIVGLYIAIVTDLLYKAYHYVADRFGGDDR